MSQKYLINNKKSKKWSNFWLFVFFIFGLNFFVFFPVYAAEPEVVIRDVGYSAQFVSQSIPDPIEIQAGATETVTFKFKNIGTKTWNNSGVNYISAYTMEPRDRNSIFYTTGWKSTKQTGKMVGNIAPGQTGSLEIKLKAPATTGEFIERFYLASENYSWVKGGYFYIKIKVVPTVVTQSDNSLTSAVSDSGNSGYQLKRIILSPKSIVAAGGSQMKLIIGYQNLGDSKWSSFEFKSDSDTFLDSSWLSESIIAKGNEEVLPENFFRKNLYIRTPTKKGEYVAKFILGVDGGKITDEIVVPITVTADAPSGYQPPSFFNSTDGGTGKIKQSLTMSAEPRLRVGISAPEGNFIQFRSYEDEYNVYSGSELKGVLPIRKLGVVKFNGSEYSFSGGDLIFTSNQFIRLEPVNNLHAVFSIANLNRPASWINPTADFDEYRGAVEYRQGEVDKKMYIVNDLLLEDYVKGMAENSSVSQTEFLKANLVAARNYAYVNKGKYSFFDVLCNTYDQLYLGVEAEKTLPNVVAAAENTRGVFVTYNDQVITTPYFGHSNGVTKSWTSVWGGSNKPWLVPVKANYDDAMYSSYSGHGVGMSQMDASNRAKNENVDFVDLLKYYYTGVQIEKLYI